MPVAARRTGQRHGGCEQGEGAAASPGAARSRRSPPRRWPPGRPPGRVGRPGGPATTAAVPATSTKGAAAADHRRPSRGTRPWTPVARSSSTSGRTFTRWVPTPSNAPAALAHRGATCGSGAAKVMTVGSRPKLSANGSHDHTERFSQALYDNADATATRWAIPAATPSSSESGTRGEGGSSAAHPTTPRLTRPDATGLSVRPTRRSRSASSQSLLQPTASWPLRKAATTAPTTRAAEPAATASRPAKSVTAAAGPGWQAIASARGRRVEAESGSTTGRA